MAEIQRFIARQPIMDEQQKVRAYELLFRSGLDNFFSATDGNAASAQVIADSFLLFGVETLTDGSQAYINFTRELLVNQCAFALPAKHVVIEILESIEPDDDVMAACRKLKGMGYKLAIDDFAFNPLYEPFLDMVDVIKIEYPKSTPAQLTALAKRFSNSGTTLLAEKIETHEDYEQARQAGCKLFQGYFFSKPVIISRRDIPSVKHHYMQLIKEINAPDMDFDNLANVVQNDVSLSVKLLKYINSAVFGLRHEISSIKHALTFLGQNEVRKWATLVALGEIANDKPEALMRLALTRARFAEAVAENVGLRQRKADFFLLGLLSVLDAMLGRPLVEVIEELPLTEDLREGLSGGRNQPGVVLQLAVAHEEADWNAVTRTAQDVGIDEASLADLYPKALQFADETVAEVATA